MKDLLGEACARIVLRTTRFSTQLSPAIIGLLLFGLAGLFLSPLTASGATYYIDFVNGVDTTNGLTQGNAWKHHPYMQGWTGSYTHSTGDKFIFKGGTTWDHTCLGLSLQAGGNGSAYDYYGVDSTWYSGASWTRPVFDGQYVECNTTNNLYGSLVDGFTHQVSNVIFDGLEICHIMAVSNIWSALVFTGGGGDNVLVTNCYLHGWQLDTTTYPGTNLSGAQQDDSHGGVIANFWSRPTNLVVDHCIIENTENTNNSVASTRQNGIAVRGMKTLRFSKIHDVGAALLGGSDVHDNEVYNVDWPVAGFNDPAAYGFVNGYHANLFYLMGPGRCYNNLVHDYGNGSSPIYVEPNWGAADTNSAIYCYNNVVYGHQSSQLAFEIDAEGMSGPAGHVYCYNNTVVNYCSGVAGFHVINRSSSSIQLASLVLINNQVIGTNAALTDAKSSTCASTSSAYDIVQSVETATGQGYVLANKYAPTSLSGSTVGTGTNLTSLNLFITDIMSVGRPFLGAWDIGAYQFAAMVLQVPPAPTGLVVIQIAQ